MIAISIIEKGANVSLTNAIYIQTQLASRQKEVTAVRALARDAVDAHEVLSAYLLRCKPSRPVPDELFKCANLWSWDHAEEIALLNRKIGELERQVSTLQNKATILDWLNANEVEVTWRTLQGERSVLVKTPDGQYGHVDLQLASEGAMRSEQPSDGN